MPSRVQETSWRMNPKVEIMYLYLYHINKMYSTLIYIHAHSNSGIRVPIVLTPEPMVVVHS
jgi:hypothetical protein